MVVGQPWALDVTSFGLANPETDESGWGAQLKNEGEPREEEKSPRAGSENTISPLRFPCIRYRLSVRLRFESPYWYPSFNELRNAINDATSPVMSAIS